MARSIWSGYVNFGLVSVPVGLYSATQEHEIDFHQFQRAAARKSTAKKTATRKKTAKKKAA
jgi:DNA end-binding protein Ku